MEPVVPQRGSSEPIKKFLDFFQSKSISNNENNFQNQLFHFQIFQLATSLKISPIVSLLLAKSHSYNIAREVMQFQPSNLLKSKACSIILWSYNDKAMKPFKCLHVN